MKAEERKEFKVKKYADMKLGIDGFIDMVKKTNDEFQQVEELRTHLERLKEDSVHYFTDIMGRYEIELTIPAESFGSNQMDENSLQAAFANDSGIMSYHLKSGSVKSDRLDD